MWYCWCWFAGLVFGFSYIFLSGNFLWCFGGLDSMSGLNGSFSVVLGFRRWSVFGGSFVEGGVLWSLLSIAGFSGMEFLYG